MGGTLRVIYVTTVALFCLCHLHFCHSENGESFGFQGLLEFSVQIVEPLTNKCFLRAEQSRSVVECVLIAKDLHSLLYNFNPGEKQCYICLPLDSVTNEAISELPDMGKTFGKGKVMRAYMHTYISYSCPCEYYTYLINLLQHTNMALHPDCYGKIK